MKEKNAPGNKKNRQNEEEKSIRQRRCHKAISYGQYERHGGVPGEARGARVLTFQEGKHFSGGCLNVPQA